MSVVDLQQTYSRTNLEGEDKAIETPLVEELIEGLEELDSDSLGDALGGGTNQPHGHCQGGHAGVFLTDDPYQ